MAPASSGGARIAGSGAKVVKGADHSQAGDGDAPPTSPSLIEGLRGRDDGRWHEVVTLYEPILIRRARRRGLDEAEALDVVQDVFTTAFQKIDGFILPTPTDGGPRPPAFRPWLSAILRFKLLEHARRREQGVGGTDAQASLMQVEDADAADAEIYDPLEAEEERTILMRKALELASRQSEPQTWEAARLFLFEGWQAPRIAAELGMTANAVHLAKFRILKRARAIYARYVGNPGEAGGG